MSQGIPRSHGTGWTTCLSVEGTGGRPLGFQGPRMMGWDGMDSVTNFIFVDGSRGCPMGFQGPICMGQDRSGTTCIFVDGSGESPMGFQGPMGQDEQWVYLYIC